MFDSLPELVEFFETQDMGEHWETMLEVRFDVEIKRKTRLVAIEREAERLAGHPGYPADWRTEGD